MRVEFIARDGVFAGYVVGVASLQEGFGWRFFPRNCRHNASRKHHATWQACVPRWVGYPARCDAKAIGFELEAGR